MRAHRFIALISLLVCGLENTVLAQISANTGTTNTPAAPARPNENQPIWYVFKIKAFHKVTHNADRSSAIVEGVTTRDKAFTVKLVWMDVFKVSHAKALDRWVSQSKGDFEKGIPYVIAGKVLSRDPLTIEPDTMAQHAPNFGAPPENVY